MGDTERADWRTFRVARLTPRIPTGPSFTARGLPDDVSEYVQRGVGAATWRYRAEDKFHASASEIRTKLPYAVSVPETGPEQCIAEVGSDTPQMSTLYIGLLDVDCDIIDALDFADDRHTMAGRFERAART